MPEASAESGENSASDTTSSIKSDLHPKHKQTLLDAYHNAEWLCSTLGEIQYMKVPSHLTNIRDSLQGLLTEQELLEHLFVCTYCGLETWEAEKPKLTQKSCPECDGTLQYAKTQTADQTSD